MQGDDFNCPTCDETLKKERGCESQGMMPSYYGNETIFKCPLKIISGVSWEYLRAYSFFKKGLLPNNKSWRDESEKFLDAMTVIENHKIRLEEAMRKKK